MESVYEMKAEPLKSCIKNMWGKKSTAMMSFGLKMFIAIRMRKASSLVIVVLVNK